MELNLKRQKSTATSTPGDLLIDGIPYCYTLEDVVREVPGRPVSEWKVAKATAIPVGRYEIVLARSNRFQRILPLLLAVEGFAGILMHGGNTHENTEGCLLVGRLRDNADRIHDCAPVLHELIRKMLEAEFRKEKIWITVEPYKGN